MAAAGWFTHTYRTLCAGTGAEKKLFRRIGKLQPRRIVEIGIGSLERACKLISTAQRFAQDDVVRYTGIDWFEERRQPLEPMPLIHAYRQLQATGATVKLMPGNPSSVIPQAANSLGRTDLILISHNVTDAALAPAWFYMPRMCQTGTQVLRESRDDEGRLIELQEITLQEISMRAQAVQDRAAA